jgi:hypothetical protein
MRVELKSTPIIFILAQNHLAKNGKKSVGSSEFAKRVQTKNESDIVRELTHFAMCLASYCLELPTATLKNRTTNSVGLPH